MILEKPIPPCPLHRTPHIVTNNWKIKLLPNPVGSIAITSLPLKIWPIALSCSFFNEKTIPVSLSSNKTSLKHTIQNLPHVPPVWPFNMIPLCPTYQSNKPRRTNRKPRSWANRFFRIEGFAGKRSLLSPPPPPSLILFALAPFSARPECENFFSRPDISFGSYENACYAGKNKWACSQATRPSASMWRWSRWEPSFWPRQCNPWRALEATGWPPVQHGANFWRSTCWAFCSLHCCMPHRSPSPAGKGCTYWWNPCAFFHFTSWEVNPPWQVIFQSFMSKLFK